MTTAYFDATAFVKLLFQEDGTEVAAALWDGSDIVVSSRVSHAEVTASIVEAGRLDLVAPRTLRQVRSAWDDYWAATRVVELTEMVERAAARLIATTSLGFLGALHVASASAVGDRDLIVVTWDPEVGSAATDAGLRRAPAGPADLADARDPARPT